MKIKFSVKGVYGCFDFEEDVDDQFNLLSENIGKKQKIAHQCFQSLLFLDLRFLSNTQYDFIKIDILSESDERRIQAYKKEHLVGAELSLQPEDQYFIISSHTLDPDPRLREKKFNETKYYQDQMPIFADAEKWIRRNILAPSEGLAGNCIKVSISF